MFLQSLRRLPPVPPIDVTQSGVIEAASQARNSLRERLGTWRNWCYAAVDRALGIELREEEWRYLDGKAGARSPHRQARGEPRPR